MKKVKHGSLVGIMLLFFLFSPFCAEASQTGIGLEGSREEEMTEDPDLTPEEWEEGLSEGISDEEVNQLIEQYLREIEMDSFKQSGTGLPSDLGTVKTLSCAELTMEAENSGKIRYTFPDENYFVSTIPFGMVSSKPVDVQISSGNIGIVTQNDTVHALSNSWHFTEEGNYQIQILSYQSLKKNLEQYQVYETFFHFTIVSDPNNALGAVSAPENFTITKVLLDGKPQPIENKHVFFLKGDGRYEIEYACQNISGLSMKTSFIRDTTAPFLSFSPELENGEADGIVEFSPSEPDCKVYMIYNGDHGYAVSNQLTAAGNYDLVVEDTAKNQRVYHLKIHQVYNPIDFRMIGAGIILLLLMGIRFFFLRRDIKVI